MDNEKNKGVAIRNLYVNYIVHKLLYTEYKIT